VNSFILYNHSIDS